jgi:hypothetical protein
VRYSFDRDFTFIADVTVSSFQTANTGILDSAYQPVEPSTSDEEQSMIALCEFNLATFTWAVPL